MRKVADIKAQIKLVKGAARAKVIAMMKTARADEFFQFAKALGGGENLVRYNFTRYLSNDLKIMLRYAGPGTFWTDMSDKAKLLQQAASAKILKK